MLKELSQENTSKAEAKIEEVTQAKEAITIQNEEIQQLMK